MRAAFVHDTYYVRHPDGEKIYSAGAFPYALWRTRFMPHFGHITVLGRERAWQGEDATRLERSSGKNVSHVLFPNINRLGIYPFKVAGIYQQIHKIAAGHDAVIIRGPSELGMLAARAARHLGKPYAVECSGCAFDHLWHHGHPAGRIYAPFKYLRARHMVRHAAGVIYVTDAFLQNRYPAAGFTARASNVDFEKPSERILENRLKRIKAQRENLVFGLIGHHGNTLKGVDIALKALAEAKDILGDFELRILGQGDPERWKALIAQAGLEGRLRFDRAVPGGEKVFQWLDEIDIYLQPSRHEGLPRALIEAMSRGCPALASNAGGSGELLDSDFIHRRGRYRQLAGHIRALIQNKDLQARQAQRNFHHAHNYSRERLAPRRQEFWNIFAESVAAAKGRRSGGA